MIHVSIIIPTYNSCEQLDRCLFSLVQLPTNRSLFEIIIIDNGSTDKTEEIVNKYRNWYSDITIRYFFDDTPGLLTGRHLGASLANGDVLTFIDQDVQVCNNWLNTIIEVMAERTDISFLTGPNFPLYESYPPEWLNFFWNKVYEGKCCGWLSLLDLGRVVQEIHPDYVWGLNFTIRKSAFHALGGFHPDATPKKYQHFQGDGETGLTMKAYKNGFKALYHYNVMLYHEVPTGRMTETYFCNRAYYQGVSNSFSQIRMENEIGLKNETKINSKKKKDINHYISAVKYRFGRILNYKKSVSEPIIPDEVRLIVDKLKQAELEGFQFHQKQFKENETVRNWVLKDNYLEYKLPI